MLVNSPVSMRAFKVSLCVKSDEFLSIHFIFLLEKKRFKKFLGTYIIGWKQNKNSPRKNELKGLEYGTVELKLKNLFLTVKKSIQEITHLLIYRRFIAVDRMISIMAIIGFHKIRESERIFGNKNKNSKFGQINSLIRSLRVFS